MSVELKTLKQYSVPITLFALGLFFQLVILPKSFPPSHYDVLGLKQYTSIEDVTEAYNKLSAKWLVGSGTPTTSAYITARYAYELLTNPLYKRDYDLFGIDEQSHVVEKLKVKYDGVKFSDVKLPLLEASSSDFTIEAYNKLSHDTFISSIDGGRAMLIQVYSDGCHRCAKFMDSWKRIISLLEDVADTGMVEVGDVELASYFADRKSTQRPFFRNGLPSLVAFPPNCRSSNCYIRYHGEFSVDAIVDWMATDILGLPRILYYTKDNLMPKFFAKSGHHKVKVLCFSKTGERAAPFLRKVAADFWPYASFGLILWRDEDSPLWWNMFNVESSPAMVILKDPGVEPVVHHGSLNNSQFLEMIENNKNQELPQLRSVTSMELGCDAKGYSRAGVNTVTWYCVVLAGRPGIELNKMRETLRKAQKVLSANHSDGGDVVQAQANAARLALKQNRLTFAWLDGEAQKSYCLFYLHSENIQETCGPRGYAPFDVSKMFIIRYKRNSTENDIIAKKKVKTMWNYNQEIDVNLASQLVARYNGSDDVQEITEWISKIIVDGDTQELPYFIDNTPDLVPDDSSPVWTKGVFAGKGLKHRIQSILLSLRDYMKEDPRVGSIFLLAACLSFGTIWLQNSRSSQVTQPETINDENSKKTRRRKPVAAKSTNDESPGSITDAVPKNAYQLLPTDSDSE